MLFRMRVGFCVVFLVGIPLSSAVWAYSGGSGTPMDPFKIAHADDLMLLGATPSDYHRHFVLVSDIDLDPNRPGGRVFEQALIAPIRNINLDPRFSGNFDGNGHVLRNIVFAGDRYLGLFGAIGPEGVVSSLGLERVWVVSQQGPSAGLAAMSWGTIDGCFVTGFVDGESVDAGGLVGSQQGGHVSSCYTEGAIAGTAQLGGLVGFLQAGGISNCYSWADVEGRDAVGGLVGRLDQGDLFHCYSSGAVRGDRLAGGLLGDSRGGSITGCFWDLGTSGQPASEGGTPASTVQMQGQELYLAAGWDFLDEQVNGSQEIWQRVAGDTYPRLTRVAVSIPDPTLKRFIEATLGKANPTRRDMLSLRRLELVHGDVASLVGLEAATHLEYLDLRANRIVSVAPLAGLQELTALGLSDNQIRNVTALSGLTQLVELGIGGNLVWDIRPLRHLVRLRMLSLYDNQITDIDALRSLLVLEILWLNNNFVTDVESLVGLDRLVWLQLRLNGLTNSNCADLTRLEQQIDSNNGRLFYDHFICP